MIYELRIYTAYRGAMARLQARFREYTVRLFERHGIQNVGYWTNSIGGRSDELWYILGYESMAQRDESWAAFPADPGWGSARAESEKDGPLVHYIETEFSVQQTSPHSLGGRTSRTETGQ
ncbi:MAG TPA: NIPSNAP family protein [Dehalococcoidia bacterium]|nr:NIPSNAP family protein [Dehalococcoidia bacterium]